MPFATFFSTALGKLAAVGLIILAVVLGVKYVMNLQSELTTAQNAAKEWEGRFNTLDSKIKDETDKDTARKDEFSKLDQANVDLICRARGMVETTGYGLPVTPAPAKEIVEVVKYRDRKVVTPVAGPATTASPTEPPMVTPSSLTIGEDIAVQTLNNSWKAYCVATNNVDETCKPFR